MKKENKKQDFKGATEDLKQIIKEEFDGNNEVRFSISERGNQRIEIEDLDKKEIWQTLECVEPIEDMTNFDDIAANMIMGILKMSEQE